MPPLWLALSLCWLDSASSAYFALHAYRALAPVQQPVSAPLLRPRVIVQDKSEVPFHFELARSSSSLYFAIDSLTGELRLQQTLRAPGLHNLTVVVRSAQSNASSDEAAVTVEAIADFSRTVCRAGAETQACFGATELTFQLQPDLLLPTPLLQLTQPLLIRELCPRWQITYRIANNVHLAGNREAAKRFRLSKKDELLLNVSLEEHPLWATITCEISCETTRIHSTVLKNATVYLAKTAPSMRFHTKDGLLEESLSLSWPDQIPAVVATLRSIDDDCGSDRLYSADLSDDFHGSLKLKSHPFAKDAQGRCHVAVELTAEGQLPADGSQEFHSTLTVRVVNARVPESTTFRLSFRRPATNPCSYSDQQTFRVNVSRNAVRLARIMALLPQPQCNLTFAVEVVKGGLDSGMFNVTQRQGIIYLQDAALLRLRSKALIYVRAKNEFYNRLLQIALTVTNDSVAGVGQCVGGQEGRRAPKSCSFAASEAVCSATCGAGATGGRCSWWSSPSTSAYLTCTPHAPTCPDRQCDELEDTFDALCPQDCTTSVLGEAMLDYSVKPPRGILRAWGACHCETPSRCVCIRVYNLTLPTTGQPADHNATGAPGDKDADPSGMAGVSGFICNQLCRQILIFCVSFLATTSFLGGMCFWRCMRTRNQRGSTEFQMETSTFAGRDALENDEEELLMNHGTLKEFRIDPLWEIDRDRLLIQGNLGSGEFAMVLKASLLPEGMEEDNRTVAVKMVKEPCTESEIRDLVIEYELLRELSHPNVIQLIGVCSQNGPFCVIVEYAENGSLKQYLRQRYGTSGYVSPVEVTELTNRDILSFGWQIACGMVYLAESKIVHRDLAARNILVTGEKNLKISDFGLSRDIYEQDAYWKQTKKTRLPVKWMAPESLTEEVYTSKSDVWSFGVVLWEIASVGATPYPGIPLERLFYLLKSDYRMSQPEACPDEVYEAMLACWRVDPTDRPTFSQLVTRLEDLLERTGDYLGVEDIVPSLQSRKPEIPKDDASADD